MAGLADHTCTHTRRCSGAARPPRRPPPSRCARAGGPAGRVLGHGRAEALARAGEASGPDLTAARPRRPRASWRRRWPRPRPPLERAIVDLDTRALDRGGFARALGLPVGPAGTRAAARVPGLAAGARPGAPRPPRPRRLRGPGHRAGAPPIPATTMSATTTTPARTRRRPRPAAAVHCSSSDRPSPITSPAADVAATACGRWSACGRSSPNARSTRRRTGAGGGPARPRSRPAGRRRRRSSPQPAVRGGARPVARPRSRCHRPSPSPSRRPPSAASRPSRRPPGRGPHPRPRSPAAPSPVEPSPVEGPTPPPVRLTNDADRAVEWTARGATSPGSSSRPADGTLSPAGSPTLRLAVTPAAPEGRRQGRGAGHRHRRVRRRRPPQHHRRASARGRPRPPRAATSSPPSRTTARSATSASHWRDGGDDRAAPAGRRGRRLRRRPCPRRPRPGGSAATDAARQPGRTPDANLPPDAC